MQAEDDSALTPELEQQYRNHRVVAYPNSSATKPSVREMAAATDGHNNIQAPHLLPLTNTLPTANNNNSGSNQPSPQPSYPSASLQPQQQQQLLRPRAHSAGRVRQRNNGGDLVQDVYDRLLRNKGQTATTSSVVSAGAGMGGSVPGDGLLHKTSSAEEAVGGAQSSASLYLPEGAENFQERYRNAVTASRGRVVQEAESSNNANANNTSSNSITTTNTSTERARSLSRGRQQLAKRWPPIKQQEDETLPAPRRSLSPKPAPGTASAATASLSPPKQRHSTSVISPPYKRPVPISLDQSPSWNNETFSNSSQVAEEKKEEYAGHETRPEHSTPSIKERINAYGKSSVVTTPRTSSVNASSVNNKAPSSAASGRRSVDPTYAASFAARDHPPKIDIYEGKKDERNPEESNGAGGVDGSLLIPPPINSDAPVSSIASPPRSPEEDRTPVTSPRNNNVGPATVPRTKSGNLANAYMAAIHSKPQQSQGPPSAFKSPSNNSTNENAPVAEITMGELADLAGNDGNSVTGVSTVSGGEEFSAAPSRSFYHATSKKPSWAHERNRVATFRSSGVGMPLKNTTTSNNHLHHPNHHSSQLGIGPSHPNSHIVPPNIANHHNSSFTPPNNDMERMVEERVQSRLADLEIRMEQRLRALVGQMEDKIMHRLDTLELKMTAAVTKKK